MKISQYLQKKITMYFLVWNGDCCGTTYLYHSQWPKNKVPFIILPRRLDSYWQRPRPQLSILWTMAVEWRSQRTHSCPVRSGSSLIRYLLEGQVHTSVLEQRQHLRYLQILRLGGQTDMPASTEATRHTPLREGMGRCTPQSRNHFHMGETK